MEGILDRQLLIESNQERAKYTIIGFWLLLAASVGMLISNIMQYNMLLQFQSGADFSIESANANDFRQAVIAIILLAVQFLIIVLYIMWFRRAYHNLHKLGNSALSYSEGWAAGSWFVPLLNLSAPYEIMKEIWYETQRNSKTTEELVREDFKPATLVGWWWALFLISSIITNISGSFTRRADSVDNLLSATTFAIVADILAIPAILLAILVVKRVSAFEDAMYSATIALPVTSVPVAEFDNNNSEAAAI